VDLSPLIFVALAVAWAVYLIPKALSHHDEVVRSRSVEKFSHTMRVLARREPVDRRNARLVVAPTRAVLRPPVETKAHATPDPVEAPAPRPISPQAARAAARRAAKRRRNVLALITVANAVVIGLAAASVIVWPWVAAPVTLLVMWLVACRLSVRAERRARTARSAIEIGLPPEVTEPDLDDTELTGELPAMPKPRESPPAGEAPAVLTGEIPIITERLAGGWDMVPTTLPTYVTKPAAPQRRTVATIDLDSTGVWSSGRNDEDSAIARSAEQATQAARDEDDKRRASGA
jgi:hypothetical protein